METPVFAPETRKADDIRAPRSSRGAAFVRLALAAAFGLALAGPFAVSSAQADEWHGGPPPPGWHGDYYGRPHWPHHHRPPPGIYYAPPPVVVAPPPPYYYAPPPVVVAPPPSGVNIIVPLTIR